MDDLDREIAEAAASVRRTRRRGRLAMLAAMTTFFVTTGVLAGIVYTLFPETGESRREQFRREREASGEPFDVVDIAHSYALYRSDQTSGSWKLVVVLGPAFALAIVVLKRLEPPPE